MGLHESWCEVNAMTAASHDSLAVGMFMSSETLASSNSKACMELALDGAGSAEDAIGSEELASEARARRKRRHTCPGPESPPLENGWNGALWRRGRYSPPPRPNSLDASLEPPDARPAPLQTNGDGAAPAAPEEKHAGPEPAEAEGAESSPEPTSDKGAAVGNGEPSPEPPSLDGEADPEASGGASGPASPPGLTAEPDAGMAPLGDKKRRLNEAQKLHLNSECHKTEILASKLRHTPCRLSGAAAAAQPPLLLPNGDEPGLLKTAVNRAAAAAETDRDSSVGPS
ncbi:skin secretory protein xP2-like [Pollicipes pollicipes]|uniref:skin secretory protein xP2-like n=1 Tax=Pollicipes pollicipes TaxID=41117 RepID=UPI001884A682|nr:skin secretory protein xP2-like [Pollicipes pollicipes]